MTTHRIKLPLAGSGVDGDPYRVYLPTYSNLRFAGDGAAWVDVPADLCPCGDDDDTYVERMTAAYPEHPRIATAAVLAMAAVAIGAHDPDVFPVAIEIRDKRGAVVATGGQRLATGEHPIEAVDPFGPGSSAVVSVEPVGGGGVRVVATLAE